MEGTEPIMTQRILYIQRDSTTFVADKTATFEAVDLFGRVSGYTASDNMNLIGVIYWGKQ